MIRLLEKARICFDIRRLRPDTLTITASIVGERIEISRFRGDESVEDGRELLLEIVTAELRENYPQEISGLAAK